MTRPEPQHFTANLFTLLQETFEEGGSYYLDKGAGLFPTLEAITPEVASRSPWDGAPSIAAHCAHLGYYLRANHNVIVGRQLRLEYDELRASLNTLPAWSDAAVADSLAIVAHTAYHLGAIRQIRRSLQVQTRHFIAAPETPPN